MSREILFKAKRKDNGEWVEGYYCKTRIGDDARPSDVIFVPFEVDRNEEWGWMKVDPDTICQYTGLTDKHDNKIWENDILCGRLDEEYPENITYKKVVWDMNGFYTKEECSTDLDPLDEFDAEYFEVCGNIFDNAELLEVKR